MGASGGVLAAVFLATGAALVVYIISGVSLTGALGVALLAAAGVGRKVWRHSSESRRSYLRKTLHAGVRAGLIATAAYDVIRYLVVKAFGFAFWPFDIFQIFGSALVGATAPLWWVTAAGVLYHVTNGVAFGIAYTIWLGRRGVIAGIAWAMALEVLMVTFYPGWLGLKALGEFLQVSMLGHLAYGATLGLVAQRLLPGEETAHGR